MAIPESFRTLLDMPAAHYGTVLADPPWDFVTWSDKGRGRSPDRFYQHMALDDLHALAVPRIAAPNCVLFLWVVDTHLPAGIRLMESWGFDYKTIAFHWRKTQVADPSKTKMGLGYWTRKEFEICLLGTRGKPARLARDVRQGIDAPRREHSRKPAAQYSLIERLCEGPFVELFARQLRPNWSTWGDQVTHFPVGD